MRKIINGKVYDTATAECVFEWSNGCYTNALDYCSEDLFRKRTGEFFLYAQGGPMSKYAKFGGNNDWGYGEYIIPITYEQAQKWAEEHLDGDEYEAIFGEIAEDDTKSALTLYMSRASIETAKRAAAKAGLSLSAYMESLIK